jgi:hypothetical protein
MTVRFTFKKDQFDEFVQKIEELEDQETYGNTEFYALIKPGGEMEIFVGEGECHD